MKMGVAKFGGSSIGTSEAIVRCAHIINDRPTYKIIVLSATSKTTNQLEVTAKLSLESIEKAIAFFDHYILDRHRKIAIDLSIEKSFSKYSVDLKNEAYSLIKKMSKNAEEEFPVIMDQLYSIGERFSALIFTDYLKKLTNLENITYVDARDVLKTDMEFNRANPIISKIKKKSSLFFNIEGLVITSGFIGKTLCGKTTTLGREGSDFSAALFAEAISADFLDIWTDVEGIATIDPRIDSSFNYLSSIPYDKATLLAESGAKVLFPRTLSPLKRNSIPLWVKSSNNIKSSGTKIYNFKENLPCFYGVTSIVESEKTIVSIIGNELNKLIKNWDDFPSSIKLEFHIIKNDNSIMRLELENKDSTEFLKTLHSWLHTL